MKTLVVAAAFAFLVAPAVAQEPPSIVGTWTGKAQGVGVADGWQTGDITWVIAEQKGAAFKGHVSYPDRDGKMGRNEFVGTIGADGKSVMTADEDGMTTGHFVDPNTMDHCYIEVGADAKISCTRVTRQR